jgi:hypothetical protein
MEREKRERKHGRKLTFGNFGPDFLHAQVMKFTPIYRGWKRVILSSLEKTFGP